LARQLFEDFGGSRQTVTSLSDGYVCGNSPQRERVSASVRDGRESFAAHTDDELFETEITHCVCRGSLGLGLDGEGEVSAASTSHNDNCHHFERFFALSSLSLGLLSCSPWIVLVPFVLSHGGLQLYSYQAAISVPYRPDVPSLLSHSRAD
jgi:hypothetical protein